MDNNKKQSHASVAGLIATAVLSLAAGFFGAGFLSPDETKNGPSAPETPAASVETVKPAATPAVDATPVFSRISDPEYNGKNGTYSFLVEAATATGDGIRYELLDKKDKVVSSNQDGFFMDIAPVQDGIYYLRAVNLRDPAVTTAPQKVSGFDVKVTKVALVSKSDLTRKFNSGSYSSSFTRDWERTYMAPGCAIHFTGIQSGEQRTPKTLGDICSRISMGTWSSVEVTSLSYDEANRITSMTVAVKYED